MILETYDASGMQYLPAARNLRFDKVAEGGEDVSLGFVLDRSSRIDWPDVGYGYGVILRKGLTPIWSGHMRHIEQDLETISVTALGNWVHLHDLTYIGGGATPGTIGRLWSDTRYGKWKPVTDDLFGGARNDRIETDLQNRLYIAPRRDETFPGGPQRYALYYMTLYDNIKRVTFTVAVAGFGAWEGRLRGYTAAFVFVEDIWVHSVDGVGAFNRTLVNDCAVLLLGISEDAGGRYAGETGATFVKVTDLHLHGTTDITPTVTDVATDIVAQLTAGGLISADASLIETIALTLEPLFYEKGESCMDALKDAASFGDANFKRLAWGVESGSDRVFVRAPERDAVRYVVPAEHAIRQNVRGQANEDFVTEGWGMYTDEEGVTQYTDKYYAHVTNAGIVVNLVGVGDDLASTVYGVLRDRPVPFGRVSAALAVVYIQRYLMEHAHPQIQSRWKVVGQVQDLMRGGAWISPSEMETGWLVQVPHLRATEAEGAAGVDLREWETTFILAGLSWDDDRKQANLIPEGANMDLDKIIKFARRFRQVEEHDELAKRVKVLGM